MTSENTLQMKKLIVLFLASHFLMFTAFSQAPSGNFVSATIKSGSQKNSIYIAIKSNTELTLAKLSSFQFTIGIPASVSPKPTLSITSLDPTMNFDLTEVTETQDGSAFTCYNFGGVGTLTGSGKTYSANTEYNYAEIFFDNPSDVGFSRLMQLPNGGTSHNVNFYIANLGADITNQTAQFYSSDPDKVSNDGNGYSGSSYVLLATSTPVKLSSFSVISKNNEALLDWAVENQDANSSHFEIERSANGKDFSQVAMVNATNNTKQSYSFTDNDPSLAGSVYYRLKMVDKDGQFAYSEIKSVQFANTGFSVLVYPNPIQSVSKLRVNLDKPEVIKVTITNSTGSTVQQFQINGQRGMNEKSINLSTVPAGSYMIRIQSGLNSKVFSVIKN